MSTVKFHGKILYTFSVCRDILLVEVLKASGICTKLALYSTKLGLSMPQHVQLYFTLLLHAKKPLTILFTLCNVWPEKVEEVASRRLLVNAKCDFIG